MHPALLTLGAHVPEGYGSRFVCVCVCVRAWVRACVRACMRVCVSVTIFPATSLIFTLQ